jgi:predicted membrane-bound mannosyltransferase
MFLCRFSFLLFSAELFPDSEVHASKKVAARRAEQSTTAPDAPWDSYDHLVALAARISHMKTVDRHLSELPERAIQIFKVLWPGEAVPGTLTLLSDRLRDAGKRFREWRCSSARAGADAALRTVCSWYEDLDLDALHSLRGDAPTDTDPALTAKRRDRAYRIAEFAPTQIFIPPPPGIRDEISDDEEENIEDEEDEETAEGEAPPERGEAPEAGTQPSVA